MLNLRVRIQLAILLAITVMFGSITAVVYLKLPSRLFGIGLYTVTVELPETGGLYDTANVTYRGVEVGRVEDVHLTEQGVRAVLALKSDVTIPADLRVEVHSQSAVGEQYIALIPKTADGPPLRAGDVIPVSRAVVPPDVNNLLDAANRGLEAIPGDDLKTLVDESDAAFSGLGPELARIVRGSNSLAIDARRNLEPMMTLIDDGPAVLDSQTDTADSIQAWARHLAALTGQFADHDASFSGVLSSGGSATDESRRLLEAVQPTLPILLANLVSIGKVGISYQNDIEQLLVLLPQGVAALQAGVVANLGTKQGYHGAYLAFHSNLNLPSTCSTGFLPAQQQRPPSLEDFPDRPTGNLYCRIPQDSPNNVRGARNIPCETVPGKRAPTVEMCESTDTYVPLNNGDNWKGDPNATLSGQDIPQQTPGPVAQTAAPLPPIATATYDPATGKYLAPDGRLYTQPELSSGADQKTWQSMLTPPTP